MQQQKWQFEKSHQVHCGTKNWWMVIIALTEVKFMVPKCIVGTYRSLIEQAKVELKSISYFWIPDCMNKQFWGGKFPTQKLIEDP